MIKLKSQLDKSVNYIDEDKFETRFVQRSDKNFIIYISSHNGCNQQCKQCWLTQTKQFSMKNNTVQNILKQVTQIFEDQKPVPPLVHFNFMARGEPLLNPNIDHGLFLSLAKLANKYGKESRIKISTIIPKKLLKIKLDDLISRFGDHEIDIYYSIYTAIDYDGFKKKWMPNASVTHEAMRILKRIEANTNCKIYLHSPFIKGENDSIPHIVALTNLVEDNNFIHKFNIVRYNNPPGIKYEESNRIYKIKQIIERRGVETEIVTRVGEDVYASCGMFV